MALAIGTNCGFVLTAPTADPAGTGTSIDGARFAVKDTSPPHASRITEVRWWCAGATEEANFEVGLYTDAGAGEPETRLFVDAVNAKGTTGAAWKTVSVDWAIDPDTVYWIAVQVDATATNTDTDIATVASTGLVTKAGTDLPADWGTPSNEFANATASIAALVEVEAPAAVTIDLTALRISGIGSALANAGIPLQADQLVPGQEDFVALWLDTGAGLAEVACYVEIIATRPDDGSAWSVLVQWTGDIDDVTDAELRIGTEAAVARAVEDTIPSTPVATFLPTSTAHLAACDIFPFPVTTSADVHADFADYPDMFADILHHALSNGTQDDAKYGRATACFYWLFHSGPAVANAADFFEAGCNAAEESYTDDTTGADPESGNIDMAGNAVHFLLTGWTNSRTRVGLFAARWGGSAWDWQGGGRRCFHAAEAMMYAYLLDIDDVEYSGNGNGPYTRAQHMTNLVTQVTAWTAGWASGDPALPVPIAGIHNVDGNTTTTAGYGPDGALVYMNGQMHVGVMRAFIKLAGESVTFDALREDWETGLVNFCDVILNDADGFDDTAGVNVWVYAIRSHLGADSIRWTSGGNAGVDWATVIAAADSGTDTNTIVEVAAFTSAAVGTWIYNKTRDAFTQIATKTSNDSVEVSPAVTGQTTGDNIFVYDGDYADKSFPGTFNWPFWWTLFQNLAFWYASESDQATTPQQVAFKNAARTGLSGAITRWNLPGTSSQWGTYNQGSGDGFFVSGVTVDQVGVNGGMGTHGMAGHSVVIASSPAAQAQEGITNTLRSSRDYVLRGRNYVRKGAQITPVIVRNYDN